MVKNNSKGENMMYAVKKMQFKVFSTFRLHFDYRSVPGGIKAAKQEFHGKKLEYTKGN